jgi:hypothetical protein
MSVRSKFGTYRNDKPNLKDVSFILSYKKLTSNKLVYCTNNVLTKDQLRKTLKLYLYHGKVKHLYSNNKH